MSTEMDSMKQLETPISRHVDLPVSAHHRCGLLATLEPVSNIHLLAVLLTNGFHCRHISTSILVKNDIPSQYCSWLAEV